MRYRTAVLMLTICALVVVAACGKRVQPVAVPTTSVPSVEEAAPPPPPPVAEAPTAPAPVAALTEDEIFARKTRDELNAERPLADASFDYNQWQVREDARSGHQKNADWLRWSSTRVTIEGIATPVAPASTAWRSGIAARKRGQRLLDEPWNSAGSSLQ